ncbi:phytoene desaturase family protein [Plebeiibacterium sediminum]|uniref:NAD(P)/FAD-dependent oxidoreductase n=1 Tax=Plebeiibacterium sediminum TaxID=2992112 RepID=A0AAE3SEW7_9BACT|nr:NAD(P)/FAD-dependent oxidoreductase [Plebeiobacterium sediminum]MCW3785568.1 NAD(P)/FAD-dependent oxidoreductase [Plebeiobacterium sediminum]
MAPKKAIIIGAGLGGLSVASYLQMNGFETQVFEKHNLPGGLCTSWKRKDYLIDGCIHFLVGTSQGESTYPILNGLIDMQKLDCVYHDSHFRMDKGKESITFYSNVDKLEKELLVKAPEDKKQILWLIKGIRKFLTIQLPVSKPIEIMDLPDKMKVGKMMLPYAIRMLKAFRISNKQFTEKLKNPHLKKAFQIGFVDELPVFSTMLMFVWRHNQQMGYPKGGAIHLSSLVANNYIDLGGTISYQQGVSKIHTNNNRATAIELENGEVHHTDIVISAADGKSTIYNLLDGKYKDEHIVERYETSTFETIDKTLYVSIGVNKDLSKEPHKTYFLLKEPIKIDQKTTLDHLEFTHYCYDPKAAPKGKSLLTLMPESLDWEYWVDLRKKDITAYNEQKQRVANQLIEALDDHLGDFKNHVEMIDVATPATYIRYTGNWTGGQNSWKAKKETAKKPNAWKIKGLNNFYMTGQWAGVSGGLNLVIVMGNHLAQMICKDFNMPFSFKQKS